MVSIKQPKKSIEFGLPSIIGYSQRNITVPRPVLCCRRFLQDSFILLFSLENMTRSTLPNCLLSNPTQSHRFPLNTADTAYRCGLCTSTREYDLDFKHVHLISCSRSKRFTNLLDLWVYARCKTVSTRALYSYFVKFYCLGWDQCFSLFHSLWRSW